MLAESINKKMISNWELHHRIFRVKNYYKCGSVKKISEQFHTFFEIINQSSKTGLVSLRRMGLRLILIRNPLTVSAILDDPGLVESKL